MANLPLPNARADVHLPSLHQRGLRDYPQGHGIPNYQLRKSWQTDCKAVRAIRTRQGQSPAPGTKQPITKSPAADAAGQFFLKRGNKNGIWWNGSAILACGLVRRYDRHACGVHGSKQNPKRTRKAQSPQKAPNAHGKPIKPRRPKRAAFFAQTRRHIEIWNYVSISTCLASYWNKTEKQRCFIPIWFFQEKIKFPKKRNRNL